MQLDIYVLKNSHQFMSKLRILRTNVAFTTFHLLQSLTAYHVTVISNNW